MLRFSLGELILNNVHLGIFKHKIIKESSWYIKVIRNDFCIINLYFTFYFMRLGFCYLDLNISKRGFCFFINQDKAFSHIIEYWAKKAGQPFSNQRWFIGSLTNIKQKFHFVQIMLATPLLFQRYYSRLYGYLKMRRAPAFAFILSTEKKDKIVIDECFYLKIPIINVMDCWQDSTFITYPLPSNVSARLSVTYWSKLVSQIILSSKFRNLLEFEPIKSKKSLDESNFYKEKKDWWKKFYYWINFKDYLNNIIKIERVNRAVERFLKKLPLNKSEDYLCFFLDELKKRININRIKRKKKKRFYFLDNIAKAKKIEDSKWIRVKRRKLKRFFHSFVISQTPSLKLRAKWNIIQRFVKYNLMQDGINYKWKTKGYFKRFRLSLKKNKINKSFLIEESDLFYNEKYNIYNKATGGSVLKKPKNLNMFGRTLFKNLYSKSESLIYKKLNRYKIRNSPLNQIFLKERMNKMYAFWRLSDEDRRTFLKGLRNNYGMTKKKIKKIQNMTMFKKKNKIVILKKEIKC